MQRLKNYIELHHKTKDRNKKPHLYVIGFVLPHFDESLALQIGECRLVLFFKMTKNRTTTN